MMTKKRPTILWDWGTAYDLFASLHVLHHPEKFGLRGSWAAGVRSRLTVPQRTILEDAQGLFLSSPLACQDDESPEMIETLKEVLNRRSWNDADLDRLRLQYQQTGKSPHSDRLVTTLNWWSRPEEFGERFLTGLQASGAGFFDEEEKRIKPYLQRALESAQTMATQMEFSKLFIELSQGVKIIALEEAEEVKFVPSYWITPLVMYTRSIKNQWVVMFGARPADVALVAGEVVPDAMLRALNALSDPTRLLILRYFSDIPQTPSHLARKLRLRAPTVIHHLSALRLAGLVYVLMDVEAEKRYTIRETAVNDTFNALRKFLLG